MQTTGNQAIFEREAPACDFHSRITRSERARPVLAQRRHRKRGRYAALAAVIAIPAMAGATDWGAATPNALPSPDIARAAPDPATFSTADYSALREGAPGRSDTDASSAFGDQAIAPGRAARVFLSAGSPLDRVRAEQCLTMAIYYEAATQPDAGQRAVAQVVLNRVAHPSYPDTVCGVVFQGSERSTGCQFSFACDGSLARQPVPYWWERARRVAREALSGEVFAPVGLATYYHTLQVHPSWEDSLVPVATIGAHRFYRLPGVAGQSSAFRVAYRGGEPLAGPHPHTITPAVDSDPDPVVLAGSYAAAQPQTALAVEKKTSAATPVYSAAIVARGGDALFRGGNLPAGGTLSPQLQNSGQWLDRP